MTPGHLAFVREDWLASWGWWCRSRLGVMEMIHDGQCAFCVRSMAAFLAFDGLRQIEVHDYRGRPSPVVASELVDKALYLVTPGRACIARLRGVPACGAAGARAVLHGTAPPPASA